jgi:phage baseplate assembly protein V
MIDAVNRLLAPLRTRIANMVARAVVALVDDAGKLQVLQLGVLADETRDGCERFQEYGFTSVPLPGAEAVVLFVGGRRDHPLVVAVDDRRHRKTGLEPGESALYNHAGAYVLCKADGSVEVHAPGSVSVNGQTVVLNGGQLPVARVGDTAGPYPIVGGNPTVKA